MNERFNRAARSARVDLAHEVDFALGRIRVRPAQRVIAGDGWQEVLEPRVMQVLVALARSRGEILSRDDLVESCWEGITVGDDAINRCIGRLRKTAESIGDAFVIETIPRVGYRLKLKEEAASPEAGSPAPIPPGKSPLKAAGLLNFLNNPLQSVAAGAALALAVVAVSLWYMRPQIVEQPAASNSLPVPAPLNNLTFNSWEVASEFNDAVFDNPYDVWRYGKEATLNGTYARLSAKARADEDPTGYIKGWMGTNDPHMGPGVSHNTQNVQVTASGSVFPPHALSMHPSETCEYAVTRFVVPMPGKYELSGRFYAMDAYGTTTDVHLSVNGIVVWNGVIDYATRPDASFTTMTTANLKPRDTIDFQVGCGSNGNYYNDATGLNAVIERKT